MDKTIFQARAISTFHSLKYFFEEDFDEGKSIQRISTGYKVLVTGGAFVGGGLISALGTKSSKFSDDEVKAEITKLRKSCDLVGIRLYTGQTQLVLFIYADDLSDDAMIGKSILIRDQMKSFKDFTMKVVWSTMGVSAKVFYVFFDSGKAFHFRQSVQEHCNHKQIWGKIYVQAWGIDISARNVWGNQGLFMTKLKAEIETKLFS
jgi:hypothetical protein